MKKINWGNGTLISPAKVEIGGVIYEVTPEQYSGTTPISAENLNLMQDNIEAGIDEAVDGAIVDEYNTSTEKTYSSNYVNGLNTYSTEEQRIGTWIDGKPIYRKVIAVKSPSSMNSHIPVADVSSLKISKIINMYGNFVGADGRQMPLPHPEHEGHITISLLNNKIEMKVANYGWTNRQCHIILEYTKTS